MGTFKRAQKFSKTSKDLDQKIQSLNEEMVKTGMSASKKDVDMSGELFNWRQEFGEAQEIKEEVDIIIEEVKEKNKKLASVQHSLVETKLTEANEIFADLYGDQVHGVVEKYIGEYASELQDLREDVIIELRKRPKDLKNLEERLDKLDKGYQILSERIGKVANASREQQLNEETGVTVNQLKQHYQTMIGKLQENLAMGSGGGGEVNLRYLDDVVGVATNPSVYDGKFLKYDHSLGKFVFETVSAGVGSESGGGGGIQLTDLSVIVTPAGISSLTYDDLTGIFEFTPPDLVGFATTGDVAGIVTSGQIVGLVTTGDLVGFKTEGDLVGYTTAGDLVGFTTEVVAGDGINVTSNNGVFTVENTGVISISAGTGLSITNDLQGNYDITAVGIATSSFNEGNFVRILTVGEGLSVNQSQGDVNLTLTGIGTSGGVSAVYVGTGLTISQNTGDVLIGLASSAAGVSSIEFIGDGVSANGTTGDVVVDLSGIGTSGAGIAGTYVQTIEAGNGIAINQISGNVIITNTGLGSTGGTVVTEVFGGEGISVSANTGSVTISATGIAITGAVNSIQVGSGLTINSPEGDVVIGIAQSIVTLSPGDASLEYNTGTFTYTPPDLSSYIQGINILDDDSSVGIVTGINFGDNLFIVGSVQAGIITITGPSPNSVIAGIDTAGTSTFENLYVSGVSTFVGASTATSFTTQQINISGIATAGILTATTLRGLNATVYNVLEVDGVSWLDGGAEFGPRTFNKGYASINTLGFGTFAGIEVAGVSTFNGAIDANGDLDVDGHTELDNLNVSGVSTFLNVINAVNVAINTERTFADINLPIYTEITSPIGDPSFNIGTSTDYSLFAVKSTNQHYVRQYTSGDYTVSVGAASSYRISNSSNFDTNATSHGGISDSDVAFVITPDAETELRYNYQKKLETTATGIAVTNQIVVGPVGTGVTIDGGTGNIFAKNSVTAGVFYGDGQFLQNISAGDIVGLDTSGQTLLTNVSISGITTVHGTNEEFATLTSSTGIVNHDCSTGHIFYHTTPTSDFTVNLTNLTLSAEHATTISIVINQGSTAYMVTSLEIAGSPVSIKWQGNNTPTGTASGIDNVTFSILNDGGTYVVLGQSVSFGGV